MGNEGSLPSNEDTEGFDYEGRSASSSIQPSSDGRSYNHGNTNGSGNNNNNAQHTHHSESSNRSGGVGRLKGSVFARRSNAHNQNSTGIERAPPASSYPSASSTNNEALSSVDRDNSGSSSYHTSAGDDLAYVMNHTNTANHNHPGTSSGGQHQQQHLQSYPGHPQQHQQQHYQQQSVYTQQQYQQQHQHQQPQYQQHYHHAQHQQTHHYQQHQQQLLHGHGNTNNSNTTTTTTKKPRPGQRAGAAIINSMRNLNIGSAMHRIGGGSKSPAHSPSRGGINLNLNLNLNSKRQHQKRQQQQQQQQQQVNDWEARWDEDSDEEDDGSLLNGGVSPRQQQLQQQHRHHQGVTATPSATTAIPTTLQHQHQQHRPQKLQIPPPQMDSGYTSAALSASEMMLPNKHNNPLAKGTEFQQQQQQKIGQHTAALYAPTTTIATTATTATDPSRAQTQHSNQQQQQRVITDDEHDAGDDDDGVEWDTGATGNDAAVLDNDATATASTAASELLLIDENDGDDGTKAPNVKQFLPLLRVLGKGSFGKVVLVQKRVGREQGSLFAMKILKKTHLVRRRQIERTRTERKVLSAVNHPFIMKLHYAFQSPEKLYLVLDYCPGGELFFHLSRFRRFPERVARFYAAELLLALGHLHKRGIIYRDLKPENVLLDADGHVKLGDFGLAKAGIRHAYEGASSMCGTPEYMAPEVLAQQGHGFCVDYWGLGMLTYEMMTGLPPWYTTDRAKLFRRLRSAPLDMPPYFSSSSVAFSSACLERNPRRRLGVTGIRAAMEHEFFKSISWRALYGRRVEAPIRPCEGWSPPGSGGDESPSNGNAQHQQHAQDQLHPSSSHSISTIPTDLDAATANFDNQFTRMPVETDDDGNGQDDDDMEELHEDTFVGFTFDDNDRDEIEAAQQMKQQQQQHQQPRPRTHHYSREGHHID